MSNGWRWNCRWLKTICIVIRDWLVSWLTIDYARAGAKEGLGICNDARLVFGLPTATHAHGRRQLRVSCGDVVAVYLLPSPDLHGGAKSSLSHLAYVDSNALPKAELCR